VSKIVKYYDACFADCLSTNKPAVESTEAEAASLAVDGLTTTFSCTQNSEAFPWWAVDLEAPYYVESVTITLPNVGGDPRNYSLSCFVYDFINSLLH